MRCKDKIAIVTGGAGGIGRAIAVELAREGARVAVWDVNEAQLAEVKTAIESIGGLVIPREVDVSGQASVQEGVQEVVDTWGGVDILVNNAGICRMGSIEDITEDEWDLVLAVNLKGTFLCSQAVIGIMKKQGAGSIINLGSLSGKVGGIVAGVVKLGINEVRSGAFKSNGDRIIWGVEAAVKEANDAGGILGKKIELVIEDNQMKGEIAVQKVKKMILNDDCQVIIQGSSSGVGGAIAQQMPRYKKIYLDVAAEAMGITGANFNPYVFRTCMNAGMHVRGLAQYFGKKGYKKVFHPMQEDRL